MKTSGTVLEILGNGRIVVEIARTSACGGNCHSCGSCGGTQSRILAECSDAVSIGDTVLVQISSQRYFLLSFLVFLVPLFLIVVGYLLLQKFLPETPASLGAVLLGILAFVVTLLAMRRLKMPKASKL